MTFSSRDEDADERPRFEVTPEIATRPQTPARFDVAAAGRQIAPAVRACGHGAHAVVMVFALFNNDGRVVAASVSQPFRGTPVGGCVLAAVRSLTLPPFQQPLFQLGFPYQLE